MDHLNIDKLFPLVELRRRGVRLRAHEGRLGYRPVEAVDDRLRASLAQHKAELLILVAKEKAERPPTPPQPPTSSASQAPAQPVVNPATGVPAPRRVGGFDVPFCWTVASWIDRLRYLAHVCIHPRRAAELREWADGLEQTLKEGAA